MDPFTQRMIERAKIRREKLDSHIGQKQELDGITVLNDNTNINEKGKEVVQGFDNEDKSKREKQYLSGIRKSKLQKLARFYSGSDENVLLENEEVDVQPNDFRDSEKQNCCKLSRLDELATKIRQWENDLDSSMYFTTKFNTNVNDVEERSTTDKENDKQSILNTSTVEKLCSQGFSFSENNSKLIFEFGKKQEKSRNLFSSHKKGTQNGQEVIDSKPKAFYDDKKLLEKSDSRRTVASQNMVLEKAAFFESSIKEEQNKVTKDPAELPLAERKAIFEKIKCETSLSRPCYTTPKTSLDSKNIERKSFKKIASSDETVVERKKKSKITEILKSSSVQIENSKQDKGDKLKESENYSHISTKERYELMRPTTNLDVNVSFSTKASPDDKPRCIPEPPPLPKSTIQTSPESKNIEKKKFQVSSSKSGRLYPSLSNIDMPEEIDTRHSQMNSSNESNKSNIYLNMTLTDLLDINKNNPSTPPSEQSFTNSKELQIINKLDKLFDYESNELSSENDDECENISSPPKMMRSSSFEYKSSDDKPETLIHTVSFYRKLQQNSCPTIKNSFCKEEREIENIEHESMLVQNKIQSLLAEVNKQQTIISQASQALNLCLSTVEFLGSGEQVEGERLLLLASHKRQACLNEIQRLKIENSLQPQGDKNFYLEKGDVYLTNISVTLKRGVSKVLTPEDSLQYFICLIKSDERVLATPAVCATRENLKDLALQFPGQIKLEGLLSNFKVTVEVYNLELRKELLPHDVKYHISNKKEKKLLTPLKNKKSESKLIKPHVQSPAGPNAVRTSLFQMCGFIVFSLKEVTRTQWTLNKVPFISPLEGSISMKIQSQLRLNDEFRGFLTMFDDISGLGAWHRRWCLLSSHIISYWKYPDDEHKKVPLGTIDLKSVITENVGLVSRDICARLNTFLLETTRPRLSGDRNSLVLNVQDNITTLRHLLSADSKQEMMTWCKKLNTTLDLLRSWKGNCDS